jgi:hypothetical protein
MGGIVRCMHAVEDRWIRPKLTALSANMRGMFRSFGRCGGWPRLEVPALEETSTRAYDS